jgi:hypothetical protein
MGVASANGRRPRSIDGRPYPDHLKPYEKLDEPLLGLLDQLQPATFDQLSDAVSDLRVRAALPRWLASAQWRHLIVRGKTPDGLRSYGLAADTSPRGR